MENILDEIFKAYDIRGKVGEQLNTEIIYEIGRAFSDWLPENGPVAVGYDMRSDSKDFAEEVIKLCESKRNNKKACSYIWS